MKGLARKYLPRSVRNKLRRLYYLPVDTTDALFGRRDALTPPRGLMFVGQGDFKQTGEQYLRKFVDPGGLERADRVLDVGCGVGQMAVPLTRYLDESATYEGFDVVPEGIRWCQQHITPRYPNFRFQLADTFNKEYNPRGRVAGSDFRFPYADGSFDFVFLTSVFTHMLPRDMEHYLSQISRVLAPKKRCLITYFLLETSAAREVRGERDFRFETGGCRSLDPYTPEKGIAYEESYVRGLYERYDLEICEPIRYGVWRECGDLQRSQDIIVACRA